MYFSTIGALVPGITEEIYFRGFLAKAFDDLSAATIILLTSLSFSLWHVLTPAYLLHTFLIGLVLAVAYHRTGSKSCPSRSLTRPRTRAPAC